MHWCAVIDDCINSLLPGVLEYDTLDGCEYVDPQRRDADLEDHARFRKILGRVTGEG